jgi:hypothetical protein
VRELEFNKVHLTKRRGHQFGEAAGNAFLISRGMMKSEGDSQSLLVLVMADTWAGLQASPKS